MTPTTLATGTTICPECGEDFKSVARHWAYSPDHRPQMSQHQHDLVFGLILGGSSIDTNNKTPSLKFRTQYRPFAVWVAESLGWLFGSLRRVPPMEGGEYHAYVLRTKPHPSLERYAPWYDGGALDIPTSREIRRLTARAWYAKAAIPSWSGESDARITEFSAAQEPKKSWVGAYLQKLGHDPRYQSNRWVLTTGETHDLISYVGGPVPGVEYKWALNRETYQSLQNERRESLAQLSAMDVEPSIDMTLYLPGEYEPDIPSADPILQESTLGKEYSRLDCIRAIREAGNIVNEPLTVSRYEELRPLLIDAPSANLIIDRFGWQSLLFEAAGHDEDDPKAWDIWEIAATLGKFCDETEKPWTRSKYDQFRQSQSRIYPSYSTISNHYGGWNEALETLAAIGVVQSKPDSLEQKQHAVQRNWTDNDLERALKKALEDQDGSLLRMEDYEDWRQTQSEMYPAATTISKRRSGWHAAVEAVGGTTNSKNVYSAEECKRYLRQALDAQSDQVLTMEDYCAWCEAQSGDFPSPEIMSGVFGSWRAAVEAVGGESGKIGRTKQYSKEDVITALRQAIEAQEDNRLSANAYREWRQNIDRPEPSRSSVKNYFDSWIDAVEAAGGRAGSKRRVSDEEILDVFRNSDEHFLTANEVAAECSIGESSIYDRLRNLAESGKLERKDIGGSGTAWWLPDGS